MKFGKVFFVSMVAGLILSVAIVYGQDKDLTEIVKNTVVTGTVQLDPDYKEKIERTKHKKHSKTVIAKDSAIVNDTIMFEGVKYTLNEETFKIRVRGQEDEKEFKGGAKVGGAYIKVTKVDKKTVHFEYQHSAFAEKVAFKKTMKR